MKFFRSALCLVLPVLLATIQSVQSNDEDNNDLTMEEAAALLELATAYNRDGTDYFCSLGNHRPHGLSCKAPYASWDSLTDKSYYSRHLPPADPEWVESLPPMEDVTEQLFRTKNGQRKEASRSTMMFATFAQYVVESIIATGFNPETGTPAYEKYEGTHQIDLMPLYGRTVEQTNALRLQDNTQGFKGRLKSQVLHEEEYSPFLYDKDGTVDPQFLPLVEEYTTQFPGGGATNRRCRALQFTDNSTFFAMGHMDGNLLPNIVALNTLFLREHNRIAGELETLYSDWDDERVFQTARNINIVLYIKLIVDEYIQHISFLPIYSLDVGPWMWNATWNKENWISAEFSVLYRFHAMVPSTLHFGGEQIPLMQSLGRNDLFVDGILNLRETFEDLSAQKAMSMEPFNTDTFLLPRETEALRMSRALGFRSYAEYAEYWGYEERPKTFEDISTDPQVVATLKELYSTVDDVEYYVGLVAQDHRTNGVFGGNLMAAVALDAFSQVYTNPLLSRNLWKEETFSGYGWKLIHEKQTLETLLQRNVPDAEGLAYIGMGDNAPLPNIVGGGSSKTNDDPVVEAAALENAGATSSASAVAIPSLLGVILVALSVLA